MDAGAQRCKEWYSVRANESLANVYTTMVKVTMDYTLDYVLIHIKTVVVFTDTHAI